MAMLGTDFNAADPPDGESTYLGASRIRDIKARLKSWAAVLFDLESGNLNANVVPSSALEALSPSPATVNTPALTIPAAAGSFRRVQVNSKGQVVAGDNPDLISLITDGGIPLSKLASIPVTTRKFVNASTTAWINKTPSNLATTYTLYGVCSSYSPPAGASLTNNLFVAVGSSGLILTSTDGQTWTQRTSGVTVDLKAVAFGNGYFVAVGAPTTGTLTILYSSDGISWSQVPGANVPAINQTLNGVAYGTTDGTNYAFVAVGGAGTAVYILGATFPNPSGTWTNRSVAIAEPFLAVAAGGTGSGLDIRAFVAVGGGAPTARRVYRSVNLANPWTVTEAGSDSTTYNAVHYIPFGPTWVIVGVGGKVDTSADLANATPWTIRTGAVGSSNLQAVVSGNAVVMAAGATSGGVTQAMLARGSAATWISQSSNTGGTQQINAIAHGAGIFVAVGASNTILVPGLVPLPNESATLKWNHFLGAVPHQTEMTFVCIDAAGDGGYAQYDEIERGSTFRNLTGDATAFVPDLFLKNVSEMQFLAGRYNAANWQPEAIRKDSITGVPTTFTLNLDKWAVKVTATVFA